MKPGLGRNFMISEHERPRKSWSEEIPKANGLDGPLLASLGAVSVYDSKNQTVAKGGEKVLPTLTGKILPGIVLLGMLSGCHSSTPSVEAGTARFPVVAPPGIVLRVRLNQPVDTQKNQPGDRFLGSLASPVVIEGVVILPKGA